MEKQKLEHVDHELMRERYQSFLTYLFPELEQADAQLETATDQLAVFVDAMAVFVTKNKKHQDLWARAGWLSHILSIRTKVRRMLNIFYDSNIWKEVEDPLDDVYDMFNYGAFFVRKFKKGDKTGRTSI